MRKLEFGWFLPTSGDTTGYGDPGQLVAPSLDLFTRVITAADAARIGIAKFQKAGQGEHPVPFYLREADVTIAKS